MLKPSIVKWILLAVVRSVLSYGALILWNTTKLGNILNRMNTVQKLACLGISEAMKSTLHYMNVDFVTTYRAGKT